MTFTSAQPLETAIEQLIVPPALLRDIWQYLLNVIWFEPDGTFLTALGILSGQDRSAAIDDRQIMYSPLGRNCRLLVRYDVLDFRF